MEFEEQLNNLRYIEDLENIDKAFLSDQNFIEQVLHKFGRSEDFSPDQVIDFAAAELKDNPQFILSTFLKVISLGYTKNYLYSNHQETISYFFENHVSRLLKDEEFCLKLVKGYCGTSLLNDASFLKDVQENNEMEWGDIDAANEENLKEFLIRETISDTTFTKTDSFLAFIDLVGWNVLKYLPNHFKSNEEIYVYALKKNIKAKEYIPADLLANSDAIKSILNEKNSAKAKRENIKITRTEYNNLWENHFQPILGDVMPSYNDYQEAENMLMDYLDIFMGVNTRNQREKVVKSWYYDHPFFDGDKPKFSVKPSIKYIMIYEARSSNRNNYFYNINHLESTDWIRDPFRAFFNYWNKPTNPLEKRDVLLQLASKGYFIIDLFPFSILFNKTIRKKIDYLTFWDLISTKLCTLGDKRLLCKNEVKICINVPATIFHRIVDDGFPTLPNCHNFDWIRGGFSLD